MNDFTQAEYEQALRDNGFKREGAMSSFHVVTTLKDGSTANFNEAAAMDDCNTLREQLAYLIDARDWENEQI